MPRRTPPPLFAGEAPASSAPVFCGRPTTTVSLLLPRRTVVGAAEADAPVVVMHNQNGTAYSGDIIGEMRTFFACAFAHADAAGLARENLILDPGIGFGKTAEQNMHVLRRMDELISYDGTDYPVLLGASRKSFIGAALDLPVEERMEATGAACVMGIERGASIVRVHDVKPIVRMCRMTDAILGA